MNRRTTLYSLLALTLISSAAIAGTSTVDGTSHDFAANITSGPAQICVFCHTPHGANVETGLSGNAPLWNQEINSAATYSVYDSPTFDASSVITAVTSSDTTGLCLGCHDGAIAPGSMYNNPNGTASGGEATVAAISISNSAKFGTDLSNDHPVNFAYSTSATAEGTGGLVALATVQAAGYLDGGGKVQCSSCHDPHVAGPDSAAGLDFMIETMVDSSLCTECHVK